MILAFDAYYEEAQSRLACVQFESWTDSEPVEVYTQTYPKAEAYEAGSFYKRELPLIINMLASFELDQIAYIIVDGYVLLDQNGRLGLGGYLYEKIEKKVPVIGVAKNYFAGSAGEELLRGNSKKPLYITSLGIPQLVAAGLIKDMHGDFRIPTLLRIMDDASKGRLER